MQFNFDQKDLEAIRQIVREEMRALINEAIAARDVAPDGPEMISVKDAAALIGVSVSTIWNLVKSGKLKKHQSGKLVRFAAADVLGILKTKKAAE